MRRAVLLAVLVVAALTPSAMARPTPRTPLVSGPAACTPQQNPALVLVASRFIPEGTLGLVILKKQMYAVASIPCADRRDGALTDPAQLKGRIATHDIYPGSQITRSDISGVLKVSLTTPVRAGHYAQLTVKVTPRARCTIQVSYDRVSKDTGLGPKTGGRITWRWKVGSNTRPGRWPVNVRCGASGTLRVKIRVLSA